LPRRALAVSHAGACLQAGGYSQIGPRPSNQDAYFVSDDLGLFLVADGMGGHNAGEVASRMAVNAIVEFIKETHDSGEMTWPFGFDPKRSMLANRLMVALRIANSRVHQAGMRELECSGMGTTIVAALTERDRIVIAHVGDSRAYRLRDGQLLQMTEDDTWLSALMAAGATSGATSHPMRHVLTNGIGMRAELTLSLTEEPMLMGDRWLVCSDGVHSFLTPRALAQLIELPSADLAAERCVESALAAGSTDNATAVVVRVD
jgi:protein phosphatase